MTKPASAYRPDRFRTTYDCLHGDQIWHWLHQPAQLRTMDVACLLRRPAVEALSPDLAEEFGPLMLSLPVRRMIGHMIRQIMDQRGRHVFRANVRIHDPANLFGWGTCYSAA